MYGEPADVQARDDGRPVRFVRRGQLYTVRAILEHWVVNREWWREPHADPAGPVLPGDRPGRGGQVQPELEFWRVEAASGPGLTAGVYELRREPGTDNWILR